MGDEATTGLCCQFASARSLIHALIEPLRLSQKKKLTPRPYNQFDPENSLWWLVPSTEWPAYDRGKLVAFREDTGETFVGLHIERGFHPKAVAAKAVSRRLAVDKTWLGARILDELENGELDRATAQVQANLGTVRVRLTTNVPDLEHVRRPPRPAERLIEWDWHGGVLTQCGKNDLPPELAGVLQDRTSLSAVARDVRSNTHWDWFWMNLFMGVLIAPVENGVKPSSRLLSGYDIAQGVAPWLNWIR